MATNSTPINDNNKQEAVMESPFSLSLLMHHAEHWIAVEAASHDTSPVYCKIRPQELKALVAAVRAAKNPDLLDLFDDTKAYPAQKQLAVCLEMFGE